MKRFAPSLAALALVVCAVGQARAGVVSVYGGPGPGSGPGSPIPGDPMYVFTFSDGIGDVAHGILNAVPSGLGDDGLHAIAGSITVTGGGLAGNTFPLISAGPGVTLSPSGHFLVDNLIYPANDAGSGANNGVGGLGSISNPSFLDNGGLLFGSGGTELNIWGNGKNDYAFVYGPPFYSGAFSGGSFQVTLVPELASLTLLGIGAVGLIGYARRRRSAVA